ncbi:hypothetical protein [Streptomyces zagrosensis]|uniref:Uncharacterized protein n=1 Tax=Streptomyces zagrosensis TaxID=1042984 RepID=A0A7W9QEY8_9ACTN|nr:hypothetical protein [Streptomyces zagrosensis]MBB5939056.1 hypothetical protein [Streptomyces zagrosensis]
MMDHQHPGERGELSQNSTGALEIWDREIACPGGPLPGAVLQVLEHGDGWVGHVQLVGGRPTSDIDKASAAIEDAFDLPVSSVVATPAAAAPNAPTGWEESGENAAARRTVGAPGRRAYTPAGSCQSPRSSGTGCLAPAVFAPGSDARR